jgi:PKD repeat protein
MNKGRRAPNMRIITVSLVLLIGLALMTGRSFSQIQPLKATVATDSSNYLLRDPVNIYGNVTYNDQPVQEGLVAVQVDDPVKKLSIRTIPAKSIPSENWSVTVVSILPCDSSGNPKTSFKRGSWAYFIITVRNNQITPRPVLTTLNIYDNSSIPIRLFYLQQTMQPQTTESFMATVWIDEWATTGTAVAYANVYDDWPRSGGYPYSPEKQATFEITKIDESAYGQSSLQSIEEVTSTYQTMLRLSPDTPLGSYLIFVTASYRGYKAYAAASFVVNVTGGPPRADFAYTPPKVGPGIEVTFDGSASTAEGYGDTITSYKWNFGDSQNATGKIVTHTYPLEGNYTVVLNVTDSEGFWNTTSQIITVQTIHDVAVKSIQCLNMIYSNWLVTITVVVKNEGTVSETFNVTAYYNTTIINVTTVTNLPMLTKSTLIFTWNTTGITIPANYTIKIQAQTVPSEINTTNNILTYGPILARMLGDVIYDRIINIYDVVKVTSIYGVQSGQPGWNPQADLAPSGKIDIYDVVKVTAIYGLSY